MAGRYLMSGTQIGLMKAALDQSKYDEVKRVLNEIYEDNFIGDSSITLSEDVEIIKRYMSSTRR